MRGSDVGQAPLEVGRKRRRTALSKVDMYAQTLVGCRQITFLGMVHPVKEVNPLHIETNELCRDA